MDANRTQAQVVSGFQSIPKSARPSSPELGPPHSTSRTVRMSSVIADKVVLETDDAGHVKRIGEQVPDHRRRVRLRMTPRGRAYFAWIVMCLCGGPPIRRFASRLIPSRPSHGWTPLDCCWALLIAAVSVRGQPLPSPRSWPALALLGVLLLGFGNGAVVWAELTVPSGLAAVLVAAMPFWMVGVEAMRTDGERVPVRHVRGLVVGFIGSSCSWA